MFILVASCPADCPPKELLLHQSSCRDGGHMTHDPVFSTASPIADHNLWDNLNVLFQPNIYQFLAALLGVPES